MEGEPIKEELMCKKLAQSMDRQRSFDQTALPRGAMIWIASCGLMLFLSISPNSSWAQAAPAVTTGVEVSETTDSSKPTKTAVFAADATESTSEDAENGRGVVTATASGAVSPIPEIDRNIVKEKITQLVTNTKSASWNTKVCEYLGDKTEESTLRVMWAGSDLQRLEVLTGRAAGKTLIVRGDTIHVGWLKFNHTNSLVKTLRGNSVKGNGYLDDMQHILNDWNNTTIVDENGYWVIDYTSPVGLPAKIWLDPLTMKVAKSHLYEEGKLVGEYEYDTVVYNPKLSEKTWKK